MYRFFDFCIDCDFPLAGLTACDDQAPAWRICLRAKDLDTTGFKWVHTWKAPDGQEIMEAARRGDDYLLHFFGLARFRLDFAAARIDALPLEGCSGNTLAHLLLDQVLPRAACHAGRMVLHASAVVLADGRAIAFAGDTGRGKSTLAAAFYLAGHPLISDDCLLLEREGESVYAIPAYPSLRLWPDTVAALVPEEDSHRLVDMAHYADKKQLLLDRDHMAAGGRYHQLAALFLLAEPGAHGGCGIRIEPAGGKTALMALIEGGFALDVADREILQRNFAISGRIADALPVFRLSYPRDYNSLPQMVQKLTRIGDFKALP